MEQVFPMLGVRFIAINDHVDSFLRPAEMDSILIPLKNLLNDSYSRDLSVKVRSAMTAKRKRGEFIGGYACYGYLKDPQDKTKLIVDPETVDTVRNIFRWYIDGQGKTPLAKNSTPWGFHRHSNNGSCGMAESVPTTNMQVKCRGFGVRRPSPPYWKIPLIWGISRKINGHRSAIKTVSG